MIYYIHSDFTSFITLPRVQKKTKFYTDKNTANEIIQISKSFNIDAKVIGKCISSSEKKLTIKSQHGEFVY